MNLQDVLRGVGGALDLDKRIYCGFSANVDVVVGVWDDDFLAFQKSVNVFPPRREQAIKPPLETREKIVDYGAWYMARGLGCDSDVRGIETMAALMEKPGNLLAIGGTGAQATNWLAYAGFRNLTLSVPYRGPELESVLHPGMTIFDNNTAYQAEIDGLKGFPDVHCIIDYAAGTKVGFRDGSVAESPRPNRVMLSQDRCCARLTIAPGFKKSLLAEEGEVAFLTSGYSAPLTEGAFDAFIADSADLIAEARKKKGKDLFVHVEECHMWGSEELRRKTVTEKVYPFVDSVGMNEEELADLARFMKLSDKKDETSVLKEIAFRYGIDRVSMHGSRNSLTLTRRDPEKERIALALAVLLSAARGYYGDFVACKDIFALPELLAGIAQEKDVPPFRDAGDGYVVVEMPTLYGMPLRSSIGLGDAFAGGIMGVL